MPGRAWYSAARSEATDTPAPAATSDCTSGKPDAAAPCGIGRPDGVCRG